MRINERTEKNEFRSKVISKLHFHPTIVNIRVEEDKLIARLDDGRELSIPANWMKPLFLQEVNLDKLKDYEILPRGQNVYFPALDEVLHVRTFTDGLKAPCCC